MPQLRGNEPILGLNNEEFGWNIKEVGKGERLEKKGESPDF
jgi:hypothetical protein